jgi:hypothetical protein
LQCRPKHPHIPAASWTEDNYRQTAPSNLGLTDFHWLLHLERKGAEF